jgi:outer membrane protein
MITYFSKPSVFILLTIYLLADPLAAQNEISGRLNVEDCIHLGLKNNPKLQSSQYFVEENRTKIDEAFSGYYPAVSVNSNANTFIKSNTYSKGESSQRYDNYSSGISISYNLFDGFRRKAWYGAAKDNYQANIYLYESETQNLTFNIIRAYYRTLQSERILTSAEEAVKNSMLHLEFARARQNAGMATRSDVLKSEVELSNAELNQIRSTNNLLAAKGNLNQLLGLISNYPIEIVDDLSEIDETMIHSFDSLFYEALNSRVEVKRFQSLMNVQQKYVQVARSGYYPTVNANTSFNYAGMELSGMQPNWWLGMTVTIPIFRGFSNNARVAGEELAVKRLEKDFESLKQQVGQEVWNAYLSVKESVERIVTTSKTVDSARENLSLAEGEYKEGIGSIIQLTDAQTIYVTAEQNYIQALADYKISNAELERTIGK